MRQINFEMIEKKLAKKNAELQEVRETRQKLLDKENFKTWLEFSYNGYEHGKFLLINSGDENFITDVLKKRLEKNRREILKNPQNLPTFILNGNEISTEKIIETLQRKISDFEIEENKYLESHSVN